MLNEHDLAKKRAICQKTVERWINENDRTLSTTISLTFETDERDRMSTLLCNVCLQFKDKLICMRNYDTSPFWWGGGGGATSVRASSFKDHAV